ncbi:MAG: LysM peptidoglycan-binding domain-containing protein [Patescibacteria group bacterium]|nr:LysM peptidoglycan-binding domain-containing protein [Patescibacteria group bacterium]
MPLQVRREKFTSVVQPETFTKTNTLSESKESSRTQNKIASIKDNTKLPLPSRSGLGRFALHASFLALVVVAVSAGKVSSQSSLVSTSASSRNERTSLITTAAVLSEGSSSMVSSDLNQKAKDLNAQTALATAGDDFLAKKQPVMSAGAPSRDILTYTVKDGDTISSLSAKFNITSDTIKWANSITDENSIKPASKLIILPVSGILYAGTGSDDIGELASRFQSNAALIDSFNSLDGKSPAEGQNIVLPDGVKPAVAAPVAQIAATSSAKSGPAVSYSLRASAGNNYSYGYCTWYVANRRYVASSLGNASQWPYNAPRAGMTVGNNPVAGSAGVTKSGNHVVYIERVDGGTVYYTEMNGPAGWGRVNSGSAPASNFRYVY